jgi:hypothetical protein
MSEELTGKGPAQVDPCPRSFRCGDLVQVRAVPPEVFSRTPRWTMGRIGRIGRTHGRWPDPDLVCRGSRDAPARELHQVAFVADESGRTVLLADLFEHWLTPVEAFVSPNHRQN